MSQRVIGWRKSGRVRPREGKAVGDTSVIDKLHRKYVSLFFSFEFSRVWFIRYQSTSTLTLPSGKSGIRQSLYTGSLGDSRGRHVAYLFSSPTRVTSHSLSLFLDYFSCSQFYYFLDPEWMKSWIFGFGRIESEWLEH